MVFLKHFYFTLYAAHALLPLMIEQLPNEPDLWLSSFPWPFEEGHKYIRGHLAVFGGDKGMLGASALAAKAAQRMSCGMVTLLARENTRDYYHLQQASLLTHMVDSTIEFTEWVEKRRVRAILIGPGRAPKDKTKQFALASLSCDVPVVLDAGAITVFENEKELLFQQIASRSHATILTPHEAEFERIFGAIENREASALHAANYSGATIILKGSSTVIADSEDDEVIVQPHASPWLATAGSGDVLSGIVSSLIASNMGRKQAAACAVWCHSRAAELVGAGLIPEDLIEALPKILTELGA